MPRCTNVLCTVTSLVALLSATAQGADCEVRQLDWLGSDGNPLVPFSRVLDVLFDFDPQNPLDQTLLGGGFVNVVIAAGGNQDWSVRNLPLVYDTPLQLSLARPSVRCGFPIQNGVPLNAVTVVVAITDQPMPSAPAGVPVAKIAAHIGYLVGGFEDGGSGAGAVIPIILPPWVGPMLPAPTEYTYTSILAPIRPVDEEIGGCAPAGAARSIQYMGDLGGFTTPSAQAIYQRLKDPEHMNCDVGPGGLGTSRSAFLSGKDSYVDEANLPIDTIQTVGLDGACAAADAIDSGGDVEVMIGWTDAAGTPIGGHAAMVTAISKWEDGSVTLTYVDDPRQGDGIAANQEHVIHIAADGTFAEGRILGFQIETIDPCPIDLDGDGEVGFDDLLSLLSSWGDCPGPGSCEPDFDGDGSVGFSDLLSLLASYGPCPG